MKKKLLIAIPLILLIGVGAAYKLVLSPAAPPPPPKKIEGSVVPLQKEFLVNLEGGRYAKVSVALVMPEAQAAHSGAEAAGLPQEAAVRAVVTDTLTGLEADALIDRDRRHQLLERIRKAIHGSTDEHVEHVLFTDITVQ